jgi:hypothetical protein
MLVEAAPPGQKGFDMDTPLDEAAALILAKLYRFCARYVSLTENSDPGDLTSQEVSVIIASGLALTPIQHVRFPGWVPSGTLGAHDGALAAGHARAAGIPNDANLWLDLEGVDSGVDSTDIIAYCNQWYSSVRAVGFVPGIYVGAGSLLTGDQLYYGLSFAHYWKSASDVPTPSVRGYQMLQGEVNVVRGGYIVDEDVTQTDSLGNRVQWVRRQP